MRTTELLDKAQWLTMMVLVWGCQLASLYERKYCLGPLHCPYSSTGNHTASFRPMLVLTAAAAQQKHSISIVTANRDLMACAQTGSGKTAAFLIPTCSAIFGQAQQLISRARPGDYHFKSRPLVLILAPTRELCCQIFDEARRVSNCQSGTVIDIYWHMHQTTVLL